MPFWIPRVIVLICLPASKKELISLPCTSQCYIIHPFITRKLNIESYFKLKLFYIICCRGFVMPLLNLLVEVVLWFASVIGGWGLKMYKYSLSSLS